MSLSVDLSSIERSEEVTCHLIPCNIEYDGSANVEKYFTSSIRQSDKNNEVQTASFRGRPLEGTQIVLPRGYSGVVLRETGKSYEDEDRQLNVTHKFTQFTSWNLDTTPSKNDKIQQAMDWVDIAHAIHSPVEDLDNSQQSVVDK